MCRPGGRRAGRGSRECMAPPTSHPEVRAVTQLLDELADTHADGPRQARCRFCDHPLSHTFVDLGMSPLCESFVPAAEANAMEAFFPLHVWVCEECFLVQLEEY